ncbi:hypothetical protein ABE501_20650 [Comamonas testosteroni]
MHTPHFNFLHLARCWRMPILMVTLTAALSACGSPARRQAQENAQTAKAMWQELCKQSGKKIYRTVENVEGIYLLKIRKSQTGELQSEYDPYGADSFGDYYIKSFLKGNYANPNRTNLNQYPNKGYNYVEAVDPEDGKRYRYTGRWIEPWQTDRSYLKGYMKFVMDKTLASGPTPRYGVTYDDITTPEQRKYWIAGSSLRVIDMQANETIAERIGYMVDLGQGSNGGGRTPWSMAARNACPVFFDREKYPQARATGQSSQTIDFVEMVLVSLNN